MPSRLPEHSLSRRHALSLLGAFGLARCGSNSDIDYATLKALYQGTMQPSSVAREDAARIPYASVGVRVDGGPQMLLVLATVTGADLLWTSNAQVAVVTRGGRVLKTAGFRENLGATWFEDSDVLVRDLAPGEKGIRLVDLPGQNAYSMPIESTLAGATPETIVILGASLQTMRVVEENHCVQRNWNFQNIFWRDPGNGFVWRSEQTLTPKGPVLEIEVLRPLQTST
ncbi:MAG TPA: YjbF family lipoprotein [Micropepsaceae bacterium]|nr:YjbF family lipoprotein [Micropepsaceae bacterium]